jgi:hypothetical protein
MKTHYRTEAEFMADFAQEQAAKSQHVASMPIHRPAPTLARKVVKPGALRYTKPQPIRVKP